MIIIPTFVRERKKERNVGEDREIDLQIFFFFENQSRAIKPIE